MTSLSQDGATDTIYIFQADGSFIYRVNQGTPIGLTFPVTIANTNATPASNILKVLFESDLTITSSLGYITINSDGIQIGDTVLQNDGTKYTITLDGVADYEGFIRNNGNSDTYLYNLSVVATNGTTLATDCGWVGGRFYGSDGINNFIIGCSSTGAITDGGGGIVGSDVATVNGEGSAELTIVGCTSSGTIGSYAGGIAGAYCGQNSGSILTIQKCSSSGTTIGTGGGGIVGQVAGSSGGQCFVQKSYSTGAIGTDAGGIYGREAGSAGSAYANDSYSRGAVESNGGGIFGREAAISSGAAVATSCYSSGSLSTSGTGIFGSASYEGATQSACYVADGSWSTTAANSALDTSQFITVVSNQPFELRNIGPSPYSLTTIVGQDDVRTVYAQTIAAGSSTSAAVLAGLSSFSILEIDGELPAEIPSITINSTTGVISTTSETTPSDYYTIVVRAVTNPYTITRVNLTVTEAPPAPTPSTTPVLAPTGKGFDFDIYNALQAGNSLVIERLQTTNLRFKSFEDYNKYKKAFATLKR